MTKVKILAMDVDGTMTDGSINFSSSGELFKTFDVKDGLGIKKAKSFGIHICIITGRISDIVAYRSKELQIDELFQGVDDKVAVLKTLADKYDCLPDEIAYIGDDDNDIGALKYAGISFCPSDASDSVKSISIVLNSKGGHGAIRECVEHILADYV